MARKRHPANEGATDPVVEKPRNRGKEEPQKGAEGNSGKRAQREGYERTPRHRYTTMNSGDQGRPQTLNPASHLERELLGRRRDGVNRREARQTLLHQLIWTDPDTVKKMGDGKWAVLVASTETHGATPRQIWGRTFENGQVVEQVVIVVQRGDADTPIPTREQLNDGELPTQVIYWEPTAINDINTTCATIAKFSASCWKEMLLVPACQLQLFTDFFHWMKETRDNLYRRDTQSIRLDRLMCIEDVVQVIGDSANGRTTEQKETTVAGVPINPNTRLFMANACDFAIRSLRAASIGVLLIGPEDGDVVCEQDNHQRHPPPPHGPPGFPRIQPPFGNPFMQMPMADGGEYHGNDDGAAIEEHAEVLRAVSAWLDANDTIGAEIEDMTPFPEVENPIHALLGRPLVEYSIPYLSGL
ncbi:unnamed protein product, partial [Mesorhabditis spiculigera]